MSETMTIKTWGEREGVTKSRIRGKPDAIQEGRVTDLTLFPPLSFPELNTEP